MGSYAHDIRCGKTFDLCDSIGEIAAIASFSFAMHETKHHVVVVASEKKKKTISHEAETSPILRMRAWKRAE